jgi:hypothetical protein
MSSVPLISHRLFVAAVGDTNCKRRLPEPMAPALATQQVPVQESTLELVDFVRPLPIQGDWPGWTLHWDDSA